MKTTKKITTKSISAKPKKQKKGYIKSIEIINGRISHEFCARVNSYISEGWQPYGQIFILNDEFCIAMVKQ